MSGMCAKKERPSAFTLLFDHTIHSASVSSFLTKVKKCSRKCQDNSELHPKIVDFRLGLVSSRLHID